MLRPFQRALLYAAAVAALGVAGCKPSTHKIVTVNGKYTSATFKDKSVTGVVAVLTKSFGPLKGYTAEIPEELQNTRISLKFTDAASAEPVRKALANATGYTVEIDTAKRVIRFVEK